MNLKITYMSGAGNLFSVIDNRKINLSGSDGKYLAPLLCNKSNYNDFETEGLMFLEKSSEYDFACQFFNPDGSSGMMCGNGGRAITRFAQLSNMVTESEVEFEMAGAIYSAEFNSNNIKLLMPSPSSNPTEDKVDLDGKIIDFHYSNTGTHHVVIDTDESKIDFENFDINKLGSEIRQHNKFSPEGTNVNFYRINNGKADLRTFEKGVEKETGACGTGAVATALTIFEKGQLEFPMNIIPSSGEELIIHLIGKYPNEIQNMVLEGPAKVLFENQINIPDLEMINNA